MKLVLTDWCFNTCIWDKTPDGFKPWGYTLTKASDGSYSVNHCFWCDVIGETEKALHITFKVGRTDHHCNITHEIDWKLWIPKSQIIKDKEVYTCDGGRYGYMEEWLDDLETQGATIKKRH